LFQTTPQLISAYPDQTTVSATFEIVLRNSPQNFQKFCQSSQYSLCMGGGTFFKVGGAQLHMKKL